MLENYEVTIHESFTYTVRINAVNEAAAANTAFSLEWITPNDEVTIVRQTATLKETKKVK